ncbi:UcrQ family [Fragilaria crotonensis]|nr:UcrQ family [Fragilaria crotonensis]
MVARVAFSRSRPLMARYDVSAHMVKWWGKVRTDEGQVTRHLSPYEQHVISHWFASWPKKVIDRAPEYIIYLGGSLGLAAFAIIGGDAADAAEDYKHRY